MRTRRPAETAFLGAFIVLWPPVIGGCLLLHFLVYKSMIDERALLFSAFGTLAGLVAAPVTIFALKHRRIRTQPESARFALAFLILSMITAAGTYFQSALFSFQHSIQWIHPPFEFKFFLDILFLFAIHAYSFAAVGLRTFLPYGLIAAVLFCVFLVKLLSLFEQQSGNEGT
ncbi:MAG: hypothetical protein AAGE61_05920 [Pseudomonadota bacterium]